MTKVALIGSAIVAIYLFRLNDAAGLMVDDAWYMMLARAIASGDGYRLVNSPTTPILPLYPPGFPALLSLGFLAAPDFPQSVWLLKSVSVTAMAVTGLLTFIHLHRDRLVPRQIAACAAAAVTLTPAFVFLATSTVMSECVFTLSQLSAVLLVQRSIDHRHRPNGAPLAALAGLVAIAAVLIRSAGVGILLAGAIWFAKERFWRGEVLFCAAAALVLAPWMLYSSAHKASDDARMAHGGSIVYEYGEQFWMRWAGAPSSGAITVADLPGRVATNLVDVFGRSMAGIVMPVVFRGQSESGEEVVSLGGAAGLSAASMGGALSTIIVSCGFALLMILGFIDAARLRLTVVEILVPVSLAITLLWPFWSFRFVLPLTPYLVFYLLSGLRRVQLWTAPATSDPWRFARIAVMVMLGMHVYDHLGYIVHVRTAATLAEDEWLARSREVDAALGWMSQNLPGRATIATTNPALVYLRTGRPTVTLDRMSEDWSVWKGRGVRYIACLLPADVPSKTLGEYKVLYQSAGRLWVIEI